ncbi:Ribosomal protein [Quillaja saponaria]|uniref:CL1 n=1 Tax=Quillaja saponaria TaxID=32244 RepID=A0AAD7PB87_QUISA|nr:Ribosomal protein [Quillaja saponaria]
MAALKLLLSQARRHCLTNRSSHFHSSPFLGSHRLLSSSSSSQSPDSEANPPIPDTPAKPPQSVPIQPVSYAVKPKDQSPPENEAFEAPPPLPPRRPREPVMNPENQETRRVWTREDIRYVKDVPSISPVSYPSRVAPLPEDRASAEGKGHDGAAIGEGSMESQEMESERKRIEADDRIRRRVLRVVEEEKAVVPFPTLILGKQKEKRPVLDLMDAILKVKANAKKKFDETVEAHVRLCIDPKRTELAVRGNMILPHSTIKPVRVAVFAQGVDADEARAAGADIVGGEELIKEIESSHKLDVDKCFSTPEMAAKLPKIAKFLKERGLLPNKNQGTVTSDISGAIKEVRQGRIDFRMEKKAIVHVGLGKVSYTEESLRENFGAFMNALLLAKPAGLKKSSKYAGYVRTFYICSTT